MMEVRTTAKRDLRQEAKKLRAYRYIFWTCLISVLVLLSVSFMLPPTGEIHPSVLQGAAILMAFSVIGILPECLRLSREVTVRKGDLEVSLSDGSDNCSKPIDIQDYEQGCNDKQEQVFLSRGVCEE